MFSYVAYGLGIRSTVPLPELISREAAVDVNIRTGKIDRPLPERDDDGNYLRATAEEAHLFWPGEGSMLVRGGCEIVVDYPPHVDVRALRLSVLGPALGVLLHQRRYLVLHASAVQMLGGAVCFLGASGWGKSTVAATLHALGHRLVTDDLLPIRFGDDEPVTFPGFPQLKLWPEAATALGNNPDALPLVQPGLVKRVCRVAEDFTLGSLPVKQIYVLAMGRDLTIERLQLREALLELVRHTYTNRLLVTTETIKAHFQQCSSLVNEVPVYRLRRPHALSLLDDVARQVEEHLAPLVSSMAL